MLVMTRIPARLSKQSVAIPAIHGLLGVVAEMLGLYIVLAAGTSVLPRSLRFTRWKLWMRIEMALWGTVLVTGLGTYVVWYVRPLH
jgi:uncharacterized membrane protein YozB (DUF420 family)